jgi:hypothetical protein
VIDRGRLRSWGVHESVDLFAPMTEIMPDRQGEGARAALRAQVKRQSKCDAAGARTIERFSPRVADEAATFAVKRSA